MKIVVNTRLLLKNRMEGIGWFAFETLKRITQQHPEHTFYFIFDRPYSNEFVFADNVKPIVISPPARHPILWYLWFEWSLPNVLKVIKPDVFVSPEGYLTLRTDIPQVNVMHDIAYEHYPETVPWLVRKYYRYYFPKFARKAKVVATVSEFSRQDIIKYYQIPAEKIKVVYNGINENFHEVPETEKLQTRQKWSSGKPYFVFVGGLQPRKNLQKLIEAFIIFKERSASDFKLLLVGKSAYKSNELEAFSRQSIYAEDIIFTGRVESQAELNKIISASYAMTYVSVFEGFGIPCLEAMKCGTAVITSNTSSMPEVCGDAALYVDPHNIESIADGLFKLASDKNLREELIVLGKIQSQKFSWQKTADMFYAIINDQLSMINKQ